MKTGALALGLLFWATLAGAETAPLHTLRAVHSLTNPEAKRALPVDFEATVTFYDAAGKDLFVQDGNLAMYVFAQPGGAMLPGDRIRIQGKTDSDFRPDVIAEKITLLSHGEPPRPAHPTFAQLIRVEFDCMRVTMRARVRSANVVRDRAESNIYLNLLVDGGYIDATVLGQDGSKLKDLLDAEVEITGAVAGKFDSKMQLAGIMLQAQSLADVKVIRPAAQKPSALPLTPMDQILNGYSIDDRTQRVRVRGTITYYQPGSAIVLQDGVRSLWITTLHEGPLQIGDVADATGFPDVRNNYATLTESEISEIGLSDPVLPAHADWAELASGKRAFDLVSIEGKVLVAVRGASKDEYVLDSSGRLFSAIYRHPDLPASVLPAMKQLAVGSRVRVTGICTLEHGSDPLGDPVAFNIMLRGFDDLELVQGPSWLNVRHLSEVVSVLLLIVIVVSARGWRLESRVRRQATTLATRIEAEAEMERRRSRILEDINSGRELPDILEQISGLVAFAVKAPCWCELANGVRLGPVIPDNLTVIRKEIPSRTDQAHGAMCVAGQSDRLPQETAFKNRPELEQAALTLRNDEITLKGARNQLLPALDVYGFYGSEALGGSQSPNACEGFGSPCVHYPPGTFPTKGYGTVLQGLFNSSAPDKGVGFSMTIPIRNRAAQAQQARSLMEYRQAELRLAQLYTQIRMQVVNAQFALTNDRAEVQSSLAARDYAQQSLDAEQKKLHLGASTTANVLQQERNLAVAENNLIAANAAFANARAGLYQVLATTLQNYGINLQDAAKGTVSTAPSIQGVKPAPNPAQPAAAPAPDQPATPPPSSR